MSPPPYEWLFPTFDTYLPSILTLAMAFSSLRGGSYLRSIDTETVIREALEHIRNLDYYSRDDSSRLVALHPLSNANSFGGFGDRNLGDDLTSDTVRRYTYHNL